MSRSSVAYKARSTDPIIQGLSIARELVAVYTGLIKQGTIGTSIKISKYFLLEPGLESVWASDRLGALFGDIVLSCFNELGPVYGKAAQIALSRADGEIARACERIQLDRIYRDWPPLEFSSIEQILDTEIPTWRETLNVERHPIGVASMAQVHSAQDRDGKSWVIKVIKPHADIRLHETLDAIEQIMRIAKPLGYNASGRRILKEVGALVNSMRSETDLLLEKQNIDRMREKLKAKKNQALRLPETKTDLCSKHVLVIEKFQGISLSDVVSGREKLSSEQRKKLAKRVLHELIVQVFEIGLFHGDPHAGNLILLSDGTVGLFDWGLAGELNEGDRRHISAILRSLMTFNMEKLVDSLEGIAREGACEVSRESIEFEIKNVADFVKLKKEQGEKPSLHELMEVCFNSAESLEIPVPDGLLMMAKSLITVEGLAKGIDPNISLGRIATPVLFKAARPELKDIIDLSKKIPKLAQRFLR